MTRWTLANIPDLRGRRTIVTGGSSGIGHATAAALASRGATITITSRDPQRGEAAAAALRAGAPNAHIDHQVLDLADLRSVRAFAATITGPLDLLINNAGIMAVQTRSLTRDGFELQLGTNHLGHFALTRLLLPLLLDAPAARIVTVSSIAHHRGRIQFDDLQLQRGYRPVRAYTQSKLANLMFALELQRRLQSAGARAISVAAHPGVASTNLASTIVAGAGRLQGAVTAAVFRLVGQSAARGALPILMAATAPDIVGGAYLGSGGFREMRGDPAPARIAAAAQDAAAAAELWRRSEELTE